jgi:DNA-binding NarL/FixJ family response regulator
MIPKPTASTRNDVRVLLVDDHPGVRLGLRLLLQVEPAVTVIGEAATGPEALALAKDLRPNLVLMDVEMPGMDGIETTSRLVELLPQCAVIILTMHGYPDMRARAMAVGAVAFIEKGRSEDIKSAIRRCQDPCP